MYMQNQLKLRTPIDKKNKVERLITSAESNKILKKELQNALKTTSKQLDDWMHMQKHKEDAQDGNSALFEFYQEMKRVKKTAPLYWYKKKK
jgi:hypothetical protein|tara:strand:- start:7 stop:279 length:273 start_codon:yes stop_codon:yes gene_type:complete